MFRKLRQQSTYHLMLLPSIILVFIFSYIPFTDSSLHFKSTILALALTRLGSGGTILLTCLVSLTL